MLEREGYRDGLVRVRMKGADEERNGSRNSNAEWQMKTGRYGEIWRIRGRGGQFERETDEKRGGEGGGGKDEIQA